MHCVDLGESFPTHIHLQNLASIQPRTGPFKFARSPRTDPPGNATAAFNLGYMYLKGVGVEQNKTKAIQLLRQASMSD